MIVYASRFQLEICAIQYTLVWNVITPSGNMYDTFARSHNEIPGRKSSVANLPESRTTRPLI